MDRLKLVSGAVLALIEAGLQVSGITNIILAVTLWGLAAVLLVWGAWHPFKTNLLPILSQWRLQSPFAKRDNNPGPVDLPSRICHVRSFAYFDQFEEGGLIKLALQFLNASDQEIALDSVSGALSYFGIAGIEKTGLHPIAWTNGLAPQHTKPFCDLHIAIQQNLSPPAFPLLLEHIRGGSGVPFFIKFHLRIRAKGMTSGDIIKVRTLDGVTCQTTNIPVVTGHFAQSFIEPITF